VSEPRPVIFIHGLWLHAGAWQPWLDYFREAGYQPMAPGWPGEPDTVEAARADPDAVAGHGIDEVTAHYAAVIDDLAVAPILIGHSFGGTIVQKLLGQGLGAAGVAIDAAPFRGVLPLPISALRSSFPVLHSPSNKDKAVALTQAQFRYAFGNAISAEESDELHARWTIPSPGKPLFQAATANFDRHTEASVEVENATRGPLLLLMGGQDHTVPEAITKATLKQYKHSTAVTDLLEFPDRGHALVIDHGWREVAAASLTWLRQQGL
jgi:pimeloyl-ACP methyl ester carboxylesterase